MKVYIRFRHQRFLEQKCYDETEDAESKLLSFYGTFS